MQPKRFSGSSVRVVLSEVRAAFGRDALILEQYTNGNTVEMLATAAPTSATPAQKISAQLRYDAEGATAPESLYVRRLRSLHFSETLLARLPAELPDWSTAMKALLRQIPLAERLPASGLVTLSGPAGAGVTSSLIRYAVHLLRSGKDPRRMRFVQLGPARLGSDEALQLAGQSLGISVQRCPLARVSAELADSHPETLVLADNSADSPATPGLPGLQDPLVPEQELLVLPAHWQMTAITDWLALRPELAGPAQRIACVVTNVDRGARWGEWLSLIAERQWPLAMVSHGAKLPDDMTLPQTTWLSEKLFDQIDRSQTVSKVKAGVQTVDQ